MNRIADKIQAFIITKIFSGMDLMTAMPSEEPHNTPF